MSVALTSYPHLTFDPTGNPVIERVGFKAIHLIREHLAYGWSAEEMALNHPQLRLGEVYSVLAWYADHAGEVDAKVRESAEFAEAHAVLPAYRSLARRLKGG